MSPVQNYIYNLSPNRQEIVQVLHNYFLSYDQIQDKIRFKIPFYYGKTWICYTNPIKKDGIELVFVRARELRDSKEFLDFKKRKMAAGISYYSPKEVDLEKVAIVFHEALELDKTKPYTFKKAKSD